MQSRKSETIKDIYENIRICRNKSEDKEKGSLVIKLIIIGVICFDWVIILVYSIFVTIRAEPLASIADTVFIAALIRSFTLVGLIVAFYLSL